ncbi:acyl-CoA thioesterase [Desulfococcus sp.]|uniref:acyl-CoA thioesterase n=1 Tax=Desulfococcus sp. TaxID=2025834 RepID=UPI0035930952
MEMDSFERPDDARFIADIDLRFRDLDAMGHVNNAVYFTYFEEGRKKIFHHIMQSNSIGDFPFIIAHAECDYLRPAGLSDPLSIMMWVSEMGVKSFTLAYQLVHRENPSVIFARGLTVQVSYDYEKSRTMPIPGELRANLEKYMPAGASTR